MKTLSDLGAPEWYIEGERRRDVSQGMLENRVSKLEQAVIAGAEAKGASAGRRWGMLVAAFISALSAGLGTCGGSAPAQQPQQQQQAK